MRKSTIAVVAAALAVVAWKAPGYVEERQASPFALWELRAGTKFEDAEALIAREERRRFTCHAIVASSRLCTVQVTGIRGTLRSVVDGRGRIVLLDFHPDTASAVLREASRKTAAEWKLIRPGVSEDLGEAPSSVTITRWTTEDFRWIASTRYDGESTSPAFLKVVDAHAMERIAASGPLARLVLQANGLIDADQAELTATLMRFHQGLSTDTSHYTPIPARAPSTAPICEPVVPDLPIPGSDTRDATRSELMLIMESAIAATYPGWGLIVGERMWMTDPSGRPERVTLGPLANSSSHAVLAFPVVFPARAEVSETQRATLEPATHCRAPTEIVIARRASDGSFRDARRTAFDPDGLASKVARLDLITSDDAEAALLGVDYITAHASDRWSGWVSWIAGIPVDFADSAAHGVRVPIRYGFDIGKGEAKAEGTLVVTGRRAEGLEVTTLEQHPWGYASRTIVVSLDSAGAILGDELLTKLF